MHFPPLGTPVHELDTPALCLDLPALDANIREVAALCASRGIQWRPHAKGHKSPDIARRLVDAGAIGLTCAKLGEAEVFAAAGIHDLLIANMIVGPRKVERLVELRQKGRSDRLHRPHRPGRADRRRDAGRRPLAARAH